MSNIQLWDNLQIKEETKKNLIKDLSEGKVPQLPYFVIGIDNVKKIVSSKISEIDSGRMLTNFIIARYGNGKTNLLKYLELFFDNNPKIKIVYKPANIDQPDLGLFLLKEIQDHFSETLVNCVKVVRDNFDFAQLTNGHPDNFKSTKEYAEQLFTHSQSDEDIKKLIYLGTGRLYTKGEFAKYNLQQLSNFERKEILVFFLNLLAINDIYVIFQIDEIEKIYEKSKLRLNAFFTSYRELFDMFSFIKGHYLICSYTDANADANFISALNDAFYSRIQPHILYLSNIEGKEQIQNLVENLNNLFNLNKNPEELAKIVSQLLKEKHSQNRQLLRNATQLLKSEETKLSLNQLLTKYKIEDLYLTTQHELELEGLFKSINQKFFDPLEAYLEGNYMLENGEIKSRDYQSFIDNINEKVHYFILNENISVENIQSRVDDLTQMFKMDLVIYSPIKLELSNGSIYAPAYKVEIVDYDPQELFVLLNMYRDNFDVQEDLAAIITSYTNNNL